MTKRTAPYRHSDGSACWTKNCSIGNAAVVNSTSFTTAAGVFAALDNKSANADSKPKAKFVKEQIVAKSYELATAAVPRDRSPDHTKYYADNDKKHMGDKDQPGSKFLSPKIKKTEDALALAIQQRGSIEGNDKEKFIALGASPDAFQESNRYLYFETPGTMGVQNSSSMDDNETLTVTRTKAGAACSLVANVKTQPKTSYAVAVIATDKNTGKDLLITTFPGMVTKSLRNADIDDLEGQKITVAQARKILGRDVWVNTKIG
jgi:hypothetical protein